MKVAILDMAGGSNAGILLGVFGYGCDVRLRKGMSLM
jgi:hypothetical protein